MVKWQRKSSDVWRYDDPETRAILTVTSIKKTIKDRNIPSREDIADVELLADGIPSLVRLYHENVKTWEKWNRQGWYPRKVDTKAFLLVVTYNSEGISNRRSEHVFEGSIDTDNPRDAQKIASEAIMKIKRRRYPSWMKKL
jgi:hypothetical protein